MCGERTKPSPCYIASMVTEAEEDQDCASRTGTIHLLSIGVYTTAEASTLSVGLLLQCPMTGVSGATATADEKVLTTSL